MSLYAGQLQTAKVPYSSQEHGPSFLPPHPQLCSLGGLHTPVWGLLLGLSFPAVLSDECTFDPVELGEEGMSLSSGHF